MGLTKKQNHKFKVKVLVPQEVSATIYAMGSYQKWMRKTMKMKTTTRELSDLPDVLMENILEGLSSADRIRFGATCKTNLSFVATQQRRRPEYEVRTIDMLPWMATFYSGLFFRRLVFRLFEPLQQLGQPNYADYQILGDQKEEGLGYLRHTTIKACKKGWFLYLWPKGESERMTCLLLFCPFNKMTIKLPDLDHYLGDRHHQLPCKATFCSDDPSSPHCAFCFFSEENGKYSISVLDQESGKRKTKISEKLISNVSFVVYNEGCFYCLSIQGELASYDVVQQTWNRVIAPSPLSNYLQSSMSRAKLHLVACEGKLIIAFVRSQVNNLEVFCCSLFDFSSSTSTWVEKTSLGDHALFLGDPTSLTVPVPSGSNIADRIYFYRIIKDKGCPIYYSFKDGPCHMSENGDYWSGVERGIWIEPLPTL